MTHKTPAVQYWNDRGRGGVERDGEAVSVERHGRRREVVVIEGHDRVDTKREGGDGVLLEHEFGGHCAWLVCMRYILRVLKGTYMLLSVMGMPVARS